MMKLSTTNIATLAYQGLFNRAPDLAGLDAWDELQPMQIVEGFLSSAEGSQIPTEANAFVSHLYANLFGRVTDAGAANWVNALNAGVMARSQVALALMTSDESAAVNHNGLIRAENALFTGTPLSTGPLDNHDPLIKVVTETKIVTEIVNVVVDPPVVTHETFGAIHPIFTKGYTVGGELLPGSGISGAANFGMQINETNNAILVIGAHERQGPSIPGTMSANNVEFHSSAGSQIGNPNRGFVAIDFGVSTGVDEIRTGEFRLGIDIDPSANKNFVYMTIENQGNGVHVWKDAAGNVRVTDGDGLRTGVSIDSTNMAFFPEIVKGASPGDVLPGQYSLALEQINLAGVVTNGLYGDLYLA